MKKGQRRKNGIFEIVHKHGMLLSISNLGCICWKILPDLRVYIAKCSYVCKVCGILSREAVIFQFISELKLLMLVQCVIGDTKERMIGTDTSKVIQMKAPMHALYERVHSQNKSLL